MSEDPGNYRPPASCEELLQRYARGERRFPNTDLSDADLTDVTLDGADFAPWSWFSCTTFRGASLRGTSFRECNVKCADFSRSDLTGASFELAGVEAAVFDGATMECTTFVGASCYGYTIRGEDKFPPS